MWAGISKRGATGVGIFEGKMNAPLYIEILRQTLLPFICGSPVPIRFVQDNDPKHTSRLARAFSSARRHQLVEDPTGIAHRESLARAKGIYSKGSEAKEQRRN